MIAIIEVPGATLECWGRHPKTHNLHFDSTWESSIDDFAALLLLALATLQLPTPKSSFSYF